MNKMTKGSLAGATGIAVLMGGFGTYALWSDSANLPSSTVNSGELYVDAGTIVWDDTAHAAAGDWDPGTDLLVPGDVITRTQTFDIVGTGTNLNGTIDFVEGAETNPFANLDIAVVVTSSNGVEVAPAGTNDFTFSGPFDSETLTAVVTYTFDGSNVTGATGLIDQDLSATLAQSTFTIAQGPIVP